MTEITIERKNIGSNTNSKEPYEKYSDRIVNFFSQLAAIQPYVETSTSTLSKKRSQTTIIHNLPSQSQYKKKINKKQILDEFKNRIVQAFTEIEEVFAIEITFNWPHIFYYRMLIKRDITTKEQANHYKEVVQSFLNMVKKEDAYSFIEICYTFVEYLETHHVDPDNALIGKHFRLSFFSKYYSEYSDTDNTPSALEIEMQKKNAQKVQKVTVQKSKFNQMNGGDESANLIYNSGELILYFDQSKRRGSFGRVSQSSTDDQKFIQIYLDPFEVNKKKITISSIYPFPTEVIANYFDNRFLILKMIDDPIENWLQNTLSFIVQKTHSFLEEKGINQSIITTLKNLCVIPYSISHLAYLPDLLRLHAVVSDLKENPPGNFYQSIDQQIQDRCSSFLNNNNNTDNNHSSHLNRLEECFEVTKEESIKQIQQYQYSDIARDTFRCYLGNCEYVLDRLREEQQYHLDGSAKQKLTSWWLSKIYQAVMVYLENLGYISSAIPDDYIANPPSDIQQIRDNLKIITEVLNIKEDIHGIQQFLQNLTDEIYVKVDEFIMNSFYSISPYIFIPPEVNAPKSVDELKSSLNHFIVIDNLPGELRDNIISVIKDLEYLLEMKEMDDSASSTPPSNGGGLVLSKVVPIKGLILGSFFRKENVLKTILELFDTSTPVNVIKPTDLRNLPPSPRSTPSLSISTLSSNSHLLPDIKNDSIDLEKLQAIRAMYTEKIKLAASAFDWESTIRLATQAKQKEAELLDGNAPSESISKLQRLRRATNTFFQT